MGKEGVLGRKFVVRVFLSSTPGHRVTSSYRLRKACNAAISCAKACWSLIVSGGQRLPLYSSHPKTSAILRDLVGGLFSFFASLFFFLQLFLSGCDLGPRPQKAAILALLALACKDFSGCQDVSCDCPMSYS